LHLMGYIELGFLASISSPSYIAGECDLARAARLPVDIPCLGQGAMRIFTQVLWEICAGLSIGRFLFLGILGTFPPTALHPKSGPSSTRRLRPLFADSGFQCQ
jgi:hypothetical protein